MTTVRKTTPTMPTPTATMLRRRQLLHSVESLRGRVRQVLNCVINLHIEFLVLESNVAAMLDEVRCLNDDYAEVQRLDTLIEALRNYNGPTICHEWPYPLIFKGTIDEAHVAQILNADTSKSNDPLLMQPTETRSLSKRASRMGSRRAKGTILS
ncbi:uncharacterized protein LOC6558963 [Drosophila grimshawi]|uniref:GH15787 n=1 Tax=Drosophila grimshawi TaxID=7222 RepID=B4IZ61_DROGR|nr:uncharacterized protein LOC6558963 [Drosophila grimshawi]EDV95583.1 GH15787 [Drosophila grimshawi]